MVEIASSLANRQVPLLLVTRDRRPSMRRALAVRTLSQSRCANVRYFARSQFGRRFQTISVMLWGSLDRGPLSAGLCRLAIIGNGRI